METEYICGPPGNRIISFIKTNNSPIYQPTT